MGGFGIDRYIIRTMARLLFVRRAFPSLIKTITKFSNAIGYQQPDLSINWTVAHVMLVIGQYTSFCARCFGALCRVNCLVFQHS